jgi:cytochrome c oxidase assembly protein subunit 11
MAATNPARPPVDRNARTGFIFAGVAAAMLGLGYAAVPLYKMFCQATGFDGTARIDTTAHAPGAVGKLINVRFDANVSPKLDWTFAPEKPVQRVAVGARQLTFFEATNHTGRTITGTAAFNVTPDQAGQYFVKIQCFCFTKQTLKPGETVRMPVIFYVDPDMLKNPNANDISEITLSYTFFPVDRKEVAG